MADFQLQYADASGQVHHQVVQGASDQEVRERFARQGFLVYTVKARNGGLVAGFKLPGTGKRLNLEKFLIFNQQFVTLVRAGLPILKALDLLAERLTDPKLRPYINSVREDVRKGTLLSEAFRSQEIFPKIYVTSIMAGEKSGSLIEVLERYVTYQKLALGVRKKVLVSLMYPCVLIVLVVLLMVFLVTYVVPSFASLYSSMSAQLPEITLYLIAIGTTARTYVLAWAGVAVVAGLVFSWWARGEAAREKLDRIKVKVPVLGDIWIKYQVAQFSRVLSTLLTGGIPLVQGLETSADSLGTPLLRNTLSKAGRHGSRRPVSLGLSCRNGCFSPAFGRHDRSGRIHWRLTVHALKRGRVLRRRCEHQDDGGSFSDRARHHDFYGDICGLCSDRPVSANLLAGGHNQMTPKIPVPAFDAGQSAAVQNAASEITAAQAAAARYRCEFVDLRDGAIDVDLFRSIPVDLMFRYNFVPLKAQNGTLEIALVDPRNLNTIDELSLLLHKKLKVRVATASQVADLLKKTEQSQRVLDEVTEGFALDVVGDEDNPDETLSIDRLSAGRQRHRAGHQAGRYHHLQRARTARQRYPHRIPRSGSRHQVPHRRRPALRHAAHREGLALHHHFAHQGHERTRYRRAPRPAGRPFPRPLQNPPDRFPRLHHADHPRRRRRAPRAR